MFPTRIAMCIPRPGILTTLALCVAAGCAPAPQGGDTVTSDSIGSFDAKNAAFDAVGVVGSLKPTMGDGGAVGPLGFSGLCTATLVSRFAVVTSKFCVFAPSPDNRQVITALDKEALFFAVGHDATHPKRLVQLASVTVAPNKIDAWASPLFESFGLGSDVALYTLVEPIDDVKPMKLATAALTDADVNKKFSEFSFGAHDTNISLGTRRVGTLTLVATEGKAMEIAYHSLAEYLKSVPDSAGRVSAVVDHDFYVSLFNEKLAKDYQAWVGGRPGDVINGAFDISAPLVRRSPDGLEVVGIHSVGSIPIGGFDKGEAFAVFGPDVQTAIAAASQDPCGTLSVTGRCSGTFAMRCSGPAELNRRVLSFDCAQVNQSCFIDPTDGATCGDAPAPTPAPVCNALVAPATKVITQQVATDPPAMPAAGALSDGTYILTAKTIYQQGGPSGPGDPASDILQVAGNTIQGVGTTYHLLSTAPTSLHVKATCPLVADQFLPYTAHGNTLTMFATGDSDAVTVSVYTKQ